MMSAKLLVNFLFRSFTNSNIFYGPKYTFNLFQWRECKSNNINLVGHIITNFFRNGSIAKIVEGTREFRLCFVQGKY